MSDSPRLLFPGTRHWTGSEEVAVEIPTNSCFATLMTKCHLRCQPYRASPTQPVINHNNNHNEDDSDSSLVGPLSWEQDTLGCMHQGQLITLSQACAYPSPGLMALCVCHALPCPSGSQPVGPCEEWPCLGKFG